MYNISFRKHYEVHAIVNVLRGLGSQHVTLISTSVAMLIRYFTIVFLVVKIRSLPKDSNAVPPSLSQTLNNDRKVCNASNTKKQPSSCFSYTTNCGTYDATQPFYLNLVRYCLIILKNNTTGQARPNKTLSSLCRVHATKLYRLSTDYYIVLSIRWGCW